MCFVFSGSPCIVHIMNVLISKSKQRKQFNKKKVNFDIRDWIKNATNRLFFFILERTDVNHSILVLRT